MTEQESIGRIINCLHRQAARYFEREMAKFDLSSGTYHYLITLFHKDGINQNELTKRLRFDKANTARSLKKLQELGYIKRVRDEHDARAYMIYLTDKAIAIKPHIKNILRHWSKILTDGFMPEEKKQAVQLVKRMADNAVTHLNISNMNH